MSFGLGLCALFAVQRLFAQTEIKVSKWEKEIRAFEAADKTNPPPQNAILFVGSSSIRRWTNVAQFFPEYKIINRGFGGSQLSDSVELADQIVIPYKPKMVLLYAGDNDIAARRSPERVFTDFKMFVGKIHAALPDTRIAYISIKACPSREKYLAQVKTANKLIRSYVRSRRKLDYIDVFTPSLTKDGKARADLYIKDGLHPNEKCYELWASIIKPFVDKCDFPKAGMK